MLQSHIMQHASGKTCYVLAIIVILCDATQKDHTSYADLLHEEVQPKMITHIMRISYMMQYNSK